MRPCARRDEGCMGDAARGSDVCPMHMGLGLEPLCGAAVTICDKKIRCVRRRGHDDEHSNGKDFGWNQVPRTTAAEFERIRRVESALEGLDVATALRVLEFVRSRTVGG